jgi:anti-anti-sigma factor
VEPPVLRGERLDDHTELVAVAGELDLSNASELRRLVDDALGQDRTRLVVDLTEVTHLDSSGLAALISAHQEADARGGRLVLVLASPHVRRTLEVRGLDRLFTMVDSIEAGRRAASG